LEKHEEAAAPDRDSIGGYAARRQRNQGSRARICPGMVTRKALFASVLSLFATVLVQAQNDNSTSLASIAARTFKATRCPGLSVAVAKNNVIIYSGAFGFADIEQQVALTTDSAHRLASLSKPVTGTIIMDLVQSDRLKLDVPVKSYLPELPAVYDKVTIRHLLTHQAGVRDYRNDDEVFNAVHYPTSRDAIKTFVNDPLLFEPGTKMAYSNFGFTMLGAIAEAATNQTFQELAKAFFHRYNLSGFDVDDPLTMVPKRVRGYHVDKEGVVSNARAYDASNKYPAGGFTSSAPDYLRFAIAVASDHVLKPELLQQTWTDQRTHDGMETHYGLGWGVSERNGRKMVGFNGLNPSSTTAFRYVPSDGVGVVALCNAEVLAGNGDQDLSSVVDPVLDAIFR
jgi:CubicO group peptidase (beta-lactamase class C family)